MVSISVVVLCKIALLSVELYVFFPVKCCIIRKKLRENLLIFLDDFADALFSLFRTIVFL